MKYFLNKPSIGQLEKKYIYDTLKSTWLSSNGKHTKEFEKKFSRFLGLKFGLAVQSGTSAIHTALKAAGVKKGDCDMPKLYLYLKFIMYFNVMRSLLLK